MLNTSNSVKMIKRHHLHNEAAISEKHTVSILFVQFILRSDYFTRKNYFTEKK